MDTPRTSSARLRLQLVRFLRNAEGASAIEFGLVAVPLFLLVMGIVEFGLILFTQMSIETAVGNVARTNTIGNTGGYPDRVTYIKEELKRQTEGLIYGSNIIISSEVINSGASSYIEPEMCLTDPPRLGPTCPPGTPFIDNNGNGVYNGGNLGNNYGSGTDLVEINVALPWKFFTPLIGAFFGSDKTVGQSMLAGTYIIRSSAIVQNEPF